ncbi:DUF4062 domain-containing protein [Mucilaginibacter celer]|uniref:DUF4062 domain-containing protein n=1 Tax=Mucilaginibacter celer TaxID=2305508 RepID=A0A494W457_9SPHI|nr:DUF4062 domain-containing protein [Mucilaginibacter celer]AYL98112.1 DUF4062 domain-containing protein [Mucilaginibacter celer]
MIKRYNIFISHVNRSLPEAREAVVKCILSLGHFPTEMTYFPASEQQSLNYIKNRIDECDYFIVLVAGLYGSGFMESEYQYAKSCNIPILTFLHSFPEGLDEEQREVTTAAIAKLNTFRSILAESAYGRWKTVADLVSVVNSSLQFIFNDKPQRGWIRDIVIPGKSFFEMPESVKELYTLNFINRFYPMEFQDEDGYILEDIRFDVFIQFVIWILNSEEADAKELAEKYKFCSPSYVYSRICMTLEELNGVGPILWPVEDFLNKMKILECLGIVNKGSVISLTSFAYKIWDRLFDGINYSNGELNQIMDDSSFFDAPELDEETSIRLNGWFL